MVGLLVPRGTYRDALDWIARARASGFESFWLSDPAHDVAVWLGALAKSIEGARFGAFISAFEDRPPLLAWKQIVTIDHLSAGRLDLVVDDQSFAAALLDVDMERFGPTPVRGLLPMWPLIEASDVDRSPEPHAVLLVDPTEAQFGEHYERSAVCILSVSLTAAENLLRSVA